VRKIRGSLFSSLDGVIQAPGGPSEDPTGGFAHGGWLPQFFDEDVGGAIDAFFGTSYDLLLGRRTYDIFAAYWPYVGGEATGVGEVFDTVGKDEGEAAAIQMGEDFTRARKYVLTRGEPDLGWSNSHPLGSMEELAAIKAGDGPRSPHPGQRHPLPRTAGGEAARRAHGDDLSGRPRPRQTLVWQGNPRACPAPRQPQAHPLGCGRCYL
jgi:dihydrofolate reductase